MKATKMFKTIYGTPDTIEVRSEPQGERDGKSFKHVLELFHPAIQKEILGFTAMANNENLVFVVKDAQGTLRVIGSEQFPATSEGGADTTGKATADRAGVTLAFSAYGNTPAPIYTGAVPLV